MSHDDFDFDSAPGLPTKLPKGETLLWQGASDWRSLAVHVFHIRKLALYFAALVIWTVGSALAADAESGLLAALWPIPAAAVALGVMVVLSWLTARSTIYSITTRRVVIRFGVALPMTINLPYATVNAAALKEHGGGCGDISLELMGDAQIAYPVLWPHVRPWRIARVQPTLRCVPEAARIARMLSNALAAEIGAGAVTAASSSNSEAPGRDRRLPAVATA